MKNKKFLGLIGCGYWGKNLARDFNSFGVLKTVSDINSKAKNQIMKISKSILFTDNYKEILEDKDITSVAIATPAKSHYKLVQESLIAKKNVFVEKPLCLNYNNGKILVSLAKKNKVKLMVGHLMLYHPAFIKMKESIKKGKVGKIRYIYSNRLALGKLRREEDVLWSFAPHDISMIMELINEKLITVRAFGARYLNKKVADTTITLLKFKNKIKAHIFVSWLHPYKDQRLVVVGDKGMLVFADVLKSREKLVFYNHKVGWVKDIPKVHKAEGKSIAFDYDTSPLKEECRAFINWILTGKEPISNGEEGLRVLKVLEMARKDLNKW
ncbi:MAG: scyllo-inositol 2-dehydrogenase (NAD(+)) [Alphaproteobacteria bacterium MarineAlpha9_Bin4]|nr:hypothetical protein [Pelagibacterales bacterium]PPR27418.1 MAG: scyllo-inositol 2-dehydrogenase (NAD(+)) [Alphaproteobacteria bacterium MarineAlpha9_Bin4]|tara:strand:- start:507 stop:1484 length:978 start_codon:yes stop_codon:yes gene_type:complete